MAGPAHGTTSEMPCAGAQAGSASVQIHCQGNAHDSAPCSCTQACQANGMPASLAPARPPLVTPRRHIARAGERLSLSLRPDNPRGVELVQVVLKYLVLVNQKPSSLMEVRILR